MTVLSCSIIPALGLFHDESGPRKFAADLNTIFKYRAIIEADIVLPNTPKYLVPHRIN